MKLKLNEGKMFWVGLVGLTIWIIWGCYFWFAWLCSPLWLFTLLEKDKGKSKG